MAARMRAAIACGGSGLEYTPATSATPALCPRPWSLAVRMRAVTAAQEAHAMASAALSSALPDRRRLGLRLLGAAGVLALLGIALASLPGLGEVRTRLADAGPGWLAVALALELG